MSDTHIVGTNFSSVCDSVDSELKSRDIWVWKDSSFPLEPQSQPHLDRKLRKDFILNPQAFQEVKLFAT